MTETKFTPGPWVAVDNGYFWDVLGKSPTYRGDVCNVHNAVRIKGINRAEQAANARLIAGAPELYEALRMAAKDLHTAACMISSEINPALFETVKRAEAVLAKARGEG